MRVIVVAAFLIVAFQANAAVDRFSYADISAFVRLCRAGQAAEVDRCIAGFLTQDEVAKNAGLIASEKAKTFVPWHGAECHTDDDGARRCTID